MVVNDYFVGEIIFHREGGEIDLVEVLENSSDGEGIRLSLRVLQTCNHFDGTLGSEFNFFRAKSGGSYGMASVGRDYPSYACCDVLRRHLTRMGLSYNEVLDSMFHKRHPLIEE